MTPSLLEPPLLTRLRQHERVLIAGAGGGFDVYAGLPLYFALRAAGKRVFFDVSARIEAFRHTVEPRPRLAIPH